MLNNTAKKIKIELIKNNTSGAEIARKLGVTRNYICQVSSGKFKTKKVRKAISDAIKIPIQELWPE